MACPKMTDNLWVKCQNPSAKMWKSRCELWAKCVQNVCSNRFSSFSKGKLSTDECNKCPVHTDLFSHLSWSGKENQMQARRNKCQQFSCQKASGSHFLCVSWPVVRDWVTAAPPRIGSAPQTAIVPAAVDSNNPKSTKQL